MEQNNWLENNIKIVGILHFLGNIFSGWILGTLLVIGYLLFSKDITPKTRQVCYNIINFNISFWIYFAISWVLIFVLIGFVLLPIVFLVWIIILIIWFIKHLSGEDYEYPLSISFIK